MVLWSCSMLLPVLVLLAGYGCVQGQAPPEVNTVAEGLWEVLDLEHQEVERPHKCDRYQEVILEVMRLALSTDPAAKKKKKELKRTIEDLYIFDMCYEMALVKAEKEELKNEDDTGNHTRDGKLFGDLIRGLIDDHLDIDLELNQNTRNRQWFRNSDRWGGRRRQGCWVGRRWNDDRRRDGNRRRWDDDRRRWDDDRHHDWMRWDDCYCTDDLCCECEPDRGGSCCRDWCNEMCDSDWDFDIERYCDRRGCEPLCRKFDHCCSHECFW